MSTDKKITIDKIKEDVINWRMHDFGACACLGNCEKCGYHKCHGCLCFLVEEINTLLAQQREQVRDEERKRIVRGIEDQITVIGVKQDNGTTVPKRVVYVTDLDEILGENI